MSGMNSGLDTESIINALTANTKLKATKQERNVLKYEATQEAYRDIISKMQNIKNKYFDILNKDSYLAGASIWNKYASKVYDAGNNETLASGISVATTINSNPGDYKVTVNKTAKQAKLTGKSISGNAKIDLSSLESGKEYGMTITVGDTEKTIRFTAGATSEATINSINDKLEEEFGESNASVGDSGNKGMVYVESDGQIVSRAGKGITMSGVGSMKTDNTLDLSNVKSGNNTVSFQIGDKTVSTSFQTIESTYFDKAIGSGMINTTTGKVDTSLDISDYAKGLARTELGESASDEEVQQKAYAIEAEINDAAMIYKQVADDYKESVRYDAFKAYKAAAEADGTWDTKVNSLYTDALAADKDTRISKWAESDETLKTAYTEYKDSFARSALSSDAVSAYDTYKSEYETSHPGETAKGIYEWAQDNDSYKKAIEDAQPAMKSAYAYLKNASLTTEQSEKLTKLEHKYEGTGDGETDYDADYYNDGYKSYQNNYATSNLSDTSKAAYESYKASVPEGETAQGIYEWAQSDATASAELTAAQASDPMKSFADWKTDKLESDSWHLNKDSWKASESNLFGQYKESVYNESGASYDLSKANILDHFNESALKNSIGNLEIDGTKFEVNYDKATNKATIKAYTETPGANEGDPPVKNYVNASLTIGNNSANSASALGNAGADATTSISQITNSTKLSDIGATADENGNYNFTINGKDFTFDGETTVNDMMKKINASSAGVKMTYSSLDNAFTITANKYGVNSKIDVEDTNGGNLLAALGIVGGTKEDGQNLEISINGKSYQSDSNMIEADGTTFTVSSTAKVGEEFTVSVGKDTSAIKDLIKDFVKDYNQLIEDVYKYLDEKPEKDYYFLTDADKEDLDLTEKQEEKWEEKSKKGLLYHDNITSSIMTGLRSALMGSVEGLDGNVFSLSVMGLKTVSDYNKHGTFAAVDEKALDDAITNHLDDIQKLFSDSENGIMKKFSAALDSGIGTTGKDKGSLIRKAGLATGSSAKDNEIYNAIKRTKTQVAALNKRYETEQNRLWKKYSNMESLLGTINSQQTSFMSYFQQ